MSNLDQLEADAAEYGWTEPGHFPQGTPDRQAVEVLRRIRGSAPYRSTRLADVVAERVEWLWADRLPLGKLVVLDGDPAVGKSTLTVDLAARVTTGRPMPGETAATVPPSAVVLMAAEDGLADTIRPRLDAAGADTARVHHLDAVPTIDEDGNERLRPPVIPADVDALEALITATGAVLVIVDVLMAYLDARNNSYRDQDVRGALAPLAAVAERTGATIVVLRHLTKSPGGSAIYRGGGSIGILAAARAALLAAIDPDDDTGTRRILAPLKSNLGAPPPAMAYRLVADDERGCARVEWLGATGHTADRLVAAPDTGEERTALEDATEWLRQVLKGRPRLRSELGKLARAEGIADRTLARARERAGVIVTRDPHTEGRPSTWTLPNEDPTDPDEYVPPPFGTYSLAHTPQPSEQGKYAESASTCHTRGHGTNPPADPVQTVVEMFPGAEVER